jgi:hypothetical protein
MEQPVGLKNSDFMSMPKPASSASEFLNESLNSHKFLISGTFYEPLKYCGSNHQAAIDGDRVIVFLAVDMGFEDQCCIV